MFYQNPSDLIQESPTLDLVNECSRFVTRHFEIISTSSPHIYHSALALTPRESIVQKLFKSHAKPFMRIVQGVPALWGQNTATATSRFEIRQAVWSPCNKFIAISPDYGIRADILDSATLRRLQSLELSQKTSPCPEVFAFSPDSRMLTSFTHGNYFLGTGQLVVSWDLHTGGVVSAIEWEGPHNATARGAHMTHSMNGTIVAVLSWYESSAIISICNVVSGVYMHNVAHGAWSNPNLALGTPNVYEIWTHGESLRFSTPTPAGITIWEVGLAPGTTPAQAENVSIPDNVVETFALKPKKQGDIARTEFHPASCRLAFTRAGTLLVWDARASKFLLNNTGTDFIHSMAFSSDGRFFACTTVESKVSLWKESATGYTLSGKITISTQPSQPHLSPNGESIVTFGESMIQLWRTKGFTVTTSIVTARPLPLLNPRRSQSLQRAEDFLLDSLPNTSFVIVARKGNKTAVVLDLESGVPQLTIDASMKIYGLRSIENTIVAIGEGHRLEPTDGGFSSWCWNGCRGQHQDNKISQSGQQHRNHSVDIPPSTIYCRSSA